MIIEREILQAADMDLSTLLLDFPELFKTFPHVFIGIRESRMTSSRCGGNRGNIFFLKFLHQFKYCRSWRCIQKNDIFSEIQVILGENSGYHSIFFHIADSAYTVHGIINTGIRTLYIAYVILIKDFDFDGHHRVSMIIESSSLYSGNFNEVKIQ